MRRSLQTGAAALVTLMVPEVGAADSIQTAIQQPTRGGGASLFTDEFVGVKFDVNEPATTTAIGGVFGQVLYISRPGGAALERLRVFRIPPPHDTPRANRRRGLSRSPWASGGPRRCRSEVKRATREQS